MQHMNPKADPCNNFYEFACGNFTQNAVIREDRSTAELFSALHDKVQEQLYETINNEIKASDPRSFQLVKQFYDVCMNEEQIDETSEKQLLEILKKLGGWPVIDGDAYDEEKFDWVEAMYAFRENGFSFNSFIGFGMGPDMKNNSKNLISVSIQHLFMGIVRWWLDDDFFKPGFSICRSTRRVWDFPSSTCPKVWSIKS